MRGSHLQLSVHLRTCSGAMSCLLPGMPGGEWGSALSSGRDGSAKLDKGSIHPRVKRVPPRLFPFSVPVVVDVWQQRAMLQALGCRILGENRPHLRRLERHTALVGPSSYWSASQMACTSPEANECNDPRGGVRDRAVRLKGDLVGSSIHTRNRGPCSQVREGACPRINRIISMARLPS